MVALLAAHPPAGPVLDVGCGTGDLAIHIAERGFETVGIDFVAAAVDQAQAKKEALPQDVAERLTFRVADALHPSLLGRSFGAVVDSGFYHLFDPGEGDRLIDECALVLRPGGRLYLHEFAVTFPVPNVPRAVPASELRERFTMERGWRVLTIRDGQFLSKVAPVPAVLACVERCESRMEDR
jgi:SAM-dependent methyltransferase